MIYVVQEAPKAEPITLADARAHLNEPPTQHDATIESAIVAARQHVELWCDRALMLQTWLAVCDAFPATIELRGGRVKEVVSVQYVDADGALQTLSESAYYADTIRDPGRLVPVSSWPATANRPNAVRVTYKVGYDDATKIPAPLIAAIKLIVGDLFENRESQVVGQSYSESETVSRLLTPYRRVVL